MTSFLSVIIPRHAFFLIPELSYYPTAHVQIWMLYTHMYMHVLVQRAVSANFESP